MTQSRRLTAILAADVAGYSRLMGVDEEGALERLKALRRKLLDPKIAEHHGRIVKTTDDGVKHRLFAAYRERPKPVSAETTILLSFLARSKISSSAAACRPYSRTCTAS